MSRITRVSTLPLFLVPCIALAAKPGQAQTNCFPCHVCDEDPEKRYVVDWGVSTLNSPEEYETLDCLYSECPETGACGGGEEEAPEENLLAMAIVLGFDHPGRRMQSTYMASVPAVVGLSPSQPKVVETPCGLRLTNLPVFADLIPQPRE